MSDSGKQPEEGIAGETLEQHLARESQFTSEEQRLVDDLARNVDPDEETFIGASLSGYRYKEQ